jgi:hypothetical protein
LGVRHHEATVSDDLAFAVFAAAVLLFCGGLFALGRWLSKRIGKHKNSTIASVSVTPAGGVLAAIQVLLLVAVAILLNLYPESAFARRLKTPSGVIAALVTFCAASGIVGALLGRRGIRLVERRVRDA